MSAPERSAISPPSVASSSGVVVRMMVTKNAAEKIGREELDHLLRAPAAAAGAAARAAGQPGAELARG